VVLSNSRGPETLQGLVDELGESANLAMLDGAAAAGDTATIVALSHVITDHGVLPKEIAEHPALKPRIAKAISLRDTGRA